MSATPHSKKFSPTTLTEKIVPAVLMFLILILLAVFVVIGLSLVGGIPSV